MRNGLSPGARESCRYRNTSLENVIGWESDFEFFFQKAGCNCKLNVNTNDNFYEYFTCCQDYI